MAHDVVDRDAARECNSTLKLLCLLTIVDFSELFLNELVNCLANSIDVGSWQD